MLLYKPIDNLKNIMKKINKKAFTLVELIIVITILAILATFAYTSFQ
jgi:prepilin-type N-terminal cleavage/methylation domain-containing protein